MDEPPAAGASSLGVRSRADAALDYPLRGELTDITEAEGRRLYTRHPWIAERALALLGGQRLQEVDDLYADFYRTLGEFLVSHPRGEERKLLSKLPLAFKYRGEFEQARRLFARAAAADPKDAVSLQAWALLEKEQGHIDQARDLFRRAAEADPKHAPTLQAWALLEKEQGQVEEARALLEQGLQRITRRRDRALLLSALGGLLAGQKNYSQAEGHFRQALELDEKNPLTHYHFAVDVLLPTGRREEACRHLRRALELKPRKPRDRQRIERAIEQHCG